MLLNNITAQYAAEYWDWRKDYWKQDKGVKLSDYNPKRRNAKTRTARNVKLTPAVKTLQMEQSALNQIFFDATERGRIQQVIKMRVKEKDTGTKRRASFESGTELASDVNTFRPNVDIVWHGDLQGDRKSQVGVILHDALETTAQTLIPENLHRPVVLEATLIHFHSLTPRARAIIGGVHKIKFSLQVIDQKTGEVLAGPTAMEADQFAYGGWEAVKADAEGQSMKIRISSRIAEVAGDWLGLVAEDEEVTQGRIFAIGR